jgi:GntR family transcriptional repressor for pyruvate dehydrogenase complex
MVDWTGLDRVSLSRSDGIAVDLERMILNGKLKPGDHIPPERELAEMAGVSRASVRDALKDLEMRGLIDRKPGRGTKRNIAQLNSLLQDMTTDLKPSQFAEIDRLFHRAVAQCTQNPMLGALTDTVNDLIAPSRANALQTKDRRRISIEGHRAIVRAIEEGDEQAAYDSAAAHLVSVQERIIEDTLKVSKKSTPRKRN